MNQGPARPGQVHEGEAMAWIPGGTFMMGSEQHYPEERPCHSAKVAGFWMDLTAVTNRDFARFVAATGHKTIAERPLDPTLYAGAPPDMLAPGALVFRMTDGPVDTRDIRHWWHWTKGACWHAPEGPGSDITGREDHPGPRRPVPAPVLLCYRLCPPRR